MFRYEFYDVTKNVVQFAVWAVIGYVVSFGISMLTRLLGIAALYISTGFADFMIGPTFVIAARKVQKRGTALLFWAVLVSWIFRR